MSTQFPTPSVGRQVWFYPDADSHHQNQPQAATVVKVHDSEWNASPFSPVNLLVIDPDTGEQTFWTDVPHSPSPTPRPHFAWMPYQLAQHNRSAIGAEVRNGCASGMVSGGNPVGF